MGKQQIEQMEPQQPQLLFYNDSTNQTGPPYYVDLFIEAGQTAIIPFADGKCKLIKGPDSWLLVSNKPEPPRPIMLLIDNLKQVVDRTGILRQLIIVNTNNNQQTNTYPTKRKSTKQIDSNNNTNGLKNGLTSPIYGKCSPNQTINATNLTTDQTTELNGLPNSPVVDQQYPFCSLCYDYSLMNGNHQLNNHNQLNGQLNNTINNQLNTVPTDANSSSIYNQSLQPPPPPPPLLETTLIPTPQPTNSLPQSTASGQLTSIITATTSNHQTAQLQQSQQTQSNPLQTVCSTKTFNSPISASNRPFNLDNLLNNQNNNLILKAAKNKLNLPINYNGQTTNQFLLNNNGKLSSKHNNYQTSTNLISLTTNSKINTSQKTETSVTIKHNRSSSYEEQQPNNNKKTTRNTTLNNLNSIKNKAKSIYSNHYNQDVYYPSHLHSNNQTINNYELKMRKDKYSNNHNLTTMQFNSVNDKLINNRIIKRKDIYRLNDKQRSLANEQLASSFHKKFDEVKSVGSPVTSNSPISEHYDFSSEESEMNLPTTNTSTSSTTNSNQSFTNNSSVNNKKFIKSDEYLINKNHHKNSQNSNCVLNYQSTHYRSQKEFFKRPISQNNQLHKMNKESPESINRRPNSNRELKDKDFKLTNGNSKKKLIQEDDRDDGYVGDEFDYKIYNVQSHHQSQTDETKKANRLNSDHKYLINKKSFNQNEFKISQNKQNKLPVNNLIKRPINNLDHNNTKIIKNNDELIKKEVNSIKEDNLLKDSDLKIKDETNSIKLLASNSSLKLNNTLPKVIIKKENVPNNQILNTKIANVQNDDLKLEKINRQISQNKINENNKSTIENKIIKTITKLQNDKDDIKIDEKIKDKEIEKEINKIDKQDQQIEQSKENSSQQKIENLEILNQDKMKPIKQNEMPKICHAFNLIETLVTSNLVRLKWTKNNGISLMNLERPNYQIEMIYNKKEENNQLMKCSRIVQQCTQKSCKVVNLNPEYEYTFRVRLVYSDQLYLSNDLTVITLANDKSIGNKKSKLKKENVINLKEQQNTLNNRSINQEHNVQTKIHRNKFNLIDFKLILNNLKDKFDFIGKEKFYALIYLFLFFTLCYLFSIICYNSYIH